MRFITKKLKFIILIFTIIIFTSCDTEDKLIADRAESFEPQTSIVTGTAGSADFSNYVALGNSLTAGFMDGSLYTDGQNNSYPNMIAEQLQLIDVGGTDFSQPDINSTLGFSFTAGTTIFGRAFLNVTNPSQPPIQFTSGGEAITPYTGDKSQLNNFGVPGATVTHLLLPGLGLGNPFYGRFATSPSSSTILGDALATTPTFFTLWIGSNDILTYATNGGDTSIAQITTVADFQTNFVNVLGQLAQTGAKGIVVNIPPVTTIPFFQVVPYNPVPIDAATAAQLNGATGFGGFNAVLDGLVGAGLLTVEAAQARKITFSVSTNHPILIFDETLSDLSSLLDILVMAGQLDAPTRAALESLTQARLTTTGDLIPLPTGSVIGTVVDNNPLLIRGVSVPLEDKDVLTITEVVEIITARATFNGIIEAVFNQVNGTSGNMGLLDVQPIFADILGLTPSLAALLAFSQAAQVRADGTVGLLVNPDGRTGPEAITGATLQPDFSPNGIFSVDAVHPNPRGQAIIANEIIKTINQTFNASIPLVNILARRSIYFQ